MVFTLVFPDLEFKIPAIRIWERLNALFPSEKNGTRYMRLVREVAHMGQQSSLRGDQMRSAGMVWQALTKGVWWLDINKAPLVPFSTPAPKIRDYGPSFWAAEISLPPVGSVPCCIVVCPHYFAGAHTPRRGRPSASVAGHRARRRLSFAVESTKFKSNGRMVGVRTAMVRVYLIRAPVVISNADCTDLRRFD